jgi:Uma2 family endonuclease
LQENPGLAGEKTQMVQVPEKVVSLEEFLKLPETKPASEYIDGEIIQKPMPQGKHSRIQVRLVTSLNHLLETPKTAMAFSELRCTFGGRSIVPDVSVFTWARIPVDQDGTIANLFPIYPDWTVEILSPDQRQTKVTKKTLHCLNAGCQMGWLIDPEEEAVLIFTPNQQPEFLEEKQAILPVPAWAIGLQLTLGEVFGWLRL